MKNIKQYDDFVNEAEEIDIKSKFPLLVAELEKLKVPCKAELTNFGGKDNINVICGWDYPESLFDKVDKAATAVGLNVNTNVDVCADSSGGTVIDTKRVAGGPKRY